MGKYSLEYQLGNYIGEFIVRQYLPTLVIDSLQSNNVIDMDKNDIYNYHVFEKDYDDIINKNSPEAKNAWDKLMAFNKEMEHKYLPEILNCYVPGFDVDNYEELKNGISDTLWDSDICCYSIKHEDIEIVEYNMEDVNPTEIRRLIKLRRRE